MIRPRRWLTRAAIVLGTALAVGCSARLSTRPPEAVPPPPSAGPSQAFEPAGVAVEDPVVALLAAAERRFESGRQELALGHLERAKAEFNCALEVLLESPSGARSDPRVRESFDRMVDRISAYEIIALTDGDGFTEKTYQAASIDDLLALSTFESPAPSADLRALVAMDLVSTSHDIAIPLNDRVLAYMDLFLGRLRDWFQNALARGGRYMPMIQGVLRAEGLPLDLAYVPLIESAFNPNAVSKAQAKGTWQFIRGTGLAYGLKVDWYIDERSNPEKSTVAAARYLRALNAQFNGNWHLALASYNGGPGLVQRAMKRTRISDFWQLRAKPRALPRETREYVPMILAAIVIARNPAQYGFDVTPDAPMEYDKVGLPQPVDLRRVAEWVGTSVDDIQALNPELRRWTTPIRYPGYELKVPKGTAPIVEARLGEAAPGETATLNWHVVKRGETLTSIAKKFAVKRTDLAGANDLSVKSSVSPGQQLIIPVAPSGLVAARPDRPTPAAGPAHHAEAVPAMAEALTPDSPVRVKIVYLVKAGDTLTSIARAHRTTVDSLKLWNALRSSRINIGDRLTIYMIRTNGPRP